MLTFQLFLLSCKILSKLLAAGLVAGQLLPELLHFHILILSIGLQAYVKATMRQQLFEQTGVLLNSGRGAGVVASSSAYKYVHACKGLT